VVDPNRVENVPDTVFEEDPMRVEKYTFSIVPSFATTVDAFNEDVLIEGPVN
jgi:hypothetical protein